MSALIDVLGRLLFGLFALLVLTIAGAAAGYLYIVPRLPVIDALKDVRLQVPLHVYSRDGRLIAEFGEKRREPLTLGEIPDLAVKAVLAAEDDRFFEHPGVDYQGLVRAAWNLLKTGEKVQGGSTITMQVARNFFLTREKTYLRKLNEIVLALKIERELDKQEILELYLNKIYLGNRAYGLGAAAQVYYGRPLRELSLAQLAMIAGLPKAPSRYNPIANPARAIERRNYILGRMLALGYIAESAYREAVAAPDSATLHNPPVEVEAAYVAEMARAEMVQRYGEDAYTGGLTVYTTIDPERQRAANEALRQALLEYDERHGYRGPEGHVELPKPHNAQQLEALLANHGSLGGLVAAVVLDVQAKRATAYVAARGEISLEWSGLSWARRQISRNARGPRPKRAGDILRVGDLIRVRHSSEGGWRLAEVPEVEGALISLDPRDGAMVAVAGGFDFYHSKFNRAIQAERQPGSSFKPFVYSAAIEKGYTPASIINDAPLVIDEPGMPTAWRPENYGGRFYGPTRLREALTYSRNLVSIRLLQAIGVDYTIDYVSRFGFQRERLPRNLTLALGTLVATPLEMARGFSVFANGGFLVSPYLIQRIEGEGGALLWQAQPEAACLHCDSALAGNGGNGTGQPEMVPTAHSVPLHPAPRVLDPRNVYLMTSMMRDVVRRGTARRATRLGRHDLAGKTGTTNDERDAWFSGFNGDLVATAWVGFDQHSPLGRAETGGRAALPMWMAYMEKALDGVPETILEEPAGLVTVRIDPETGLQARVDDPQAIFETFPAAQVPPRETEELDRSHEPLGGERLVIPEQLF